jgi:hypothetical protein
MSDKDQKEQMFSNLPLKADVRSARFKSTDERTSRMGNKVPDIPPTSSSNVCAAIAADRAVRRAL